MFACLRTKNRLCFCHGESMYYQNWVFAIASNSITNIIFSQATLLPFAVAARRVQYYFCEGTYCTIVTENLYSLSKSRDKRDTRSPIMKGFRRFSPNVDWNV